MKVKFRRSKLICHVQRSTVRERERTKIRIGEKKGLNPKGERDESQGKGKTGSRKGVETRTRDMEKGELEPVRIYGPKGRQTKERSNQNQGRGKRRVQGTGKD